MIAIPAAVVWMILQSIGNGPTEGFVNFRPTLAEAQVPADFRMEESRFAYKMTPIRSTANYDVFKLEFPSPVETADPLNNTVHADYFRPAGDGPFPGVVVLHILGGDFALSRYLAARLADRGVAALFVRLPFYGERRPPGAGGFMTADVERSLGAMRQGILDVRRASAWLASRREVDPGRLGVAGVSLGGIVSATAASVDPEIRSAALLLAGGGLADVLWKMPEAARYRKLWLESGRTKADLRALVEPVDPLTHADRLQEKRILMINGRVDEVIPPASATALWERAGRPEIEWLDCGHYSAAGFLLPAIRRVVDFYAHWNLEAEAADQVEPPDESKDRSVSRAQFKACLADRLRITSRGWSDPIRSSRERVPFLSASPR